MSSASYLKSRHPELPLDTTLIRQGFLKTLIDIRKIYSKHDVSEIIVCADTKPYWRKEIFPYYKAARDLPQSPKIPINQLELKKQIKLYFEELHSAGVFKTLKVPGAEADDIIAVMCQFLTKDEKVLIVSSDQDFLQLQCYPVIQYSTMARKEITPPNGPARFLMEKIMRGDVGDGIPNVLSDDDTLVTPGKRQVPLRASNLNSLVSDWKCNMLEPAVAARVETNLKLISLLTIPEHIKKPIIAMYETEVEPTLSLYDYISTKAPFFLGDIGFLTVKKRNSLTHELFA